MAYYCSLNTTTVTATGHLSHTEWTGAGDADWSIAWDFVVTTNSGTRSLAGRPSTSTRAIRISSTGVIVVNGVAAINQSPAGTVLAGNRYTVKLESVGTTKNLYVKLATDSSFGAPVCTGVDNNAYVFSNVCQASTSYSRVFDIYGVATVGGTFTESWNGLNAPSTGTAWTGANGGILTLNNTQGVADAWWVFYSSGGTTQRMKYYNGASWIAKPLKYYNGSSWVEKPIKYHNGTSWT